MTTTRPGRRGPRTTVRGPRPRVDRPWLATLTGLVAISAYGGAVALAAGRSDLGPDITDRLPWGSDLFAGLALLVVVAIPMTVAAHHAVTGHPHTSRAAAVAGLLLIGWIAVEILMIRAVSWLQPTLVIGGLVTVWAARRPHTTRS